MIGKLNKKFYSYHKVPSKKISDGSYFVDNDFFDLKISKKKIKSKLKINSKKIVLFVGKLISRKNPIEFLQLAKLFRNNKDIKFIMIGNGILKKECAQYVKKNNLLNVSIKGFVNQKEIRDYYWISDLLVVPSLYETWGLNINEAFASNTTVICTKNCGASEDLVDNGKTGFKYNVGDLRTLYKKTNYILNNKKIKNQISINMKKKLRKYNINTTLKSINKIINEK